MNLRSLNFQCLFSFYQAAELGSFKLAAETLFISAAAVSQQIRTLEEQLDVKLFERQHRKVVLTEEGNLLFQNAKQGFLAFEEGLRQISNDMNPNGLSISTLPSFSQDWLVPRLGAFSEANPELSVMIMPKNSLVDFSREQVDLVIRFGRGEYEGLNCEFLMPDHLYPVCHPLYKEKHGLDSLESLQQAKLIEDARPDMSWKLWLELAGVDMPEPNPALVYLGAHMVLEGALSVQGVALVRHSLAWKFIEQGLLVRIGQTEVRSTYGYWLCTPTPYLKREKVNKFYRWIKQEAEEFWQQSQTNQTDTRRIIESDINKSFPPVC